MKKFPAYMRLFLSITLISGICISAYAQPNITDISPKSGPIGTLVTITGSGFLNAVSGNTVFFGSIKASVIGTPTSTSIQVSVPAGATYGRILVQSSVTAPPLYAISNVAFNVTDGSSSCIMTNATFLPVKNFTVGSTNPKKGIARSDLDGDGKADLVIIENASNLVYVLKNTSTANGVVSFMTGLTFAGSSTTMTDVAIGDLDGDKKPDLIFTNSSASSITCFRNTSTGIGSIAFSSAINITPVSGFQPFALVIGDIDKDGRQDVVIANRANSSISILRNTSSVGTITFSSTVTTIPSGALPNALSLIDINSDGKRDLVTANSGSNTISMVQNNSTPGSISFASAVSVSAGTGSVPQAVISGDMNEDGKYDLIVACKGTNAVSVFENLGTSSISASSVGIPNQIVISGSIAPIDVDLGDMNGDGLPDIAVAGQIAGNTNGLWILQNTHQTGAAAITFAPGVNYSTGTNQIDKLAVGDYNLDGRTDVALSYTTSLPASGSIISVFQKGTQLAAPDKAETISGSSPLCSGQSGTFTIDAVAGASSYNWTLPTGASIVSGNNANAIIANMGTATGVLMVQVTPVNSCNYGDPASLPITVQKNPVITTTSPVTRCDSGTVTLSAAADLGSALWYYQPTGGTSIASGTTFTTEKLKTSTVYYVEAFIGGCTSTSRKAVTATINLLPVVKVTATSTTICFGSTTELSTTGAATYSWSPSGSLSAGNAANPTAFPSDTTTYTVTGTDANGCVNTAAIKINVNPVPNITASTVQPTICEGSVTELRAQGGINYVWTPALNLSNATSANPSASPLTTTTYNVLGTDQNGCSNNASISIVVNAKPNVKAFSNLMTICMGSSVELTANGASNYSWKPVLTLSAANIVSPVATPTETTTYVVTGTDANNCSNKDSITIDVNQNPVIKITPTQTQICLGSSTSLTAGNAVSYVWEPSSDLSSTVSPAPTCIPQSAGMHTYTVTGTDANSCKGTATIAIKVDALPTVSASANPLTICEGSSAQLTAFGARNYSWTTSPATGSFNGSSQSASPTVSTIYTVTGTDENNCANAATVAVVVNPKPPVTAATTAPNNTICNGVTTSLKASGAQTYVWAPAASITNPADAVTNAGPTVTTTYSVTGTDGNNCTNKASVTLTVVPIPTINSATPASNCGPGSLTLEALSTFGSIAWFDAPSGGAVLNNGNTFSTGYLSNTKNYYAQVSYLGCINPVRSTVAATINTIPTVIVQASKDTICAGSAVTLSGSVANTYIWNTSATTRNITVSPATTTTYILSETDQNLCTNTAAYKITVIPIPSITSTTGGTRCGTGPVSMSAAASNGIISWYRTPTATNVRGTGNNFTTTVDITSTTTYYIAATEYTCTTPTRVPVIATINVPVITPATLPTGNLGFAYSKNMSVSILTAPTWSSSGDLPPGVSLNPNSGQLSGILTAGGVYMFTLTAEQGGCSASQTYTVTINVVKVSTTWNGAAWSNGAPNTNTDAVLEGNYTTSNPAHGNFTCDNLTVAAGEILSIEQAATITIHGSVFNYGVIRQQCTAAVNLSGTTTGNPIQILQPQLTPQTIPRGKVNNAYVQGVDFTTSFGTPALQFDTIGTVPPGLSIEPGTNRLSGTPTTPGIYTFKIAAIDGNCLSVTPDIKLTIIDLLPASLAFKDRLTAKNWLDRSCVLPISSISNAPVTYSISQTGSCAVIDPVSGEIRFQCASPDKGIWIVAQQERNTSFKEAKDSTLIYIMKGKPSLALKTNPGILVQSPVLFEYNLTNGYDGQAYYTQVSGDTIASLQQNGIITAVKTGTINIMLHLPATANYNSLDTVFTFQTYIAKQYPVAHADTIVLTRNSDGSLNDGSLEPLRNDIGKTGTLVTSLTDIDVINPGNQHILFVPSIATFELDTVTGIVTIRPFPGYNGGQRIGYYITDSDGLVSSVAYITINTESFKQNIRANEVMSPNNDGLNDAFIVGYTDIIKNNTLSVFDEAGNTIYQASNYRNDWEGTNKNGKTLEPGLYYYVFKEHEGEQRELIGYIQIVR